MMAQYYQVLNQHEKSDNQTSFDLYEGRTVQYVLASEAPQPPQQFQTQPVVVSSEQLMVVEGQSQQVIVDQAQVTYQQPQSFIIHDSNTQQQVYYMANAPQNQQIVVEQAPPQPLVLNHQLMQNQISKMAEQPLHQVVQKGGNALLNIKKLPGRNPVAQSPVSSPNVSLNETMTLYAAKEDNDGLMSLPDGTLVSVNQYKKIVAEQKQSLHEQLGISTLSSTNPRGRGRGSGAPKGRKPRPQPQRAQIFAENDQFEARHQQVQSPKQQFLIQPPSRGPESKPQVKRPLPSFLQSSQIQTIIENTPVNEEYSDSIRMLVLLENGEQRLITFTLPKEACTIQEILEQVNVPFTSDTAIQVNEANTNGLNYIVTVGNVAGFNMEHSNEEVPQQEKPRLPQQPQVAPPENGSCRPAAIKSPELPASPEVSKDYQPKFIDGKLAVCSMCGYLSEDFNKCARCKRKLPENVKSVGQATNEANIEMKRKVSLGIDKKFTICKSTNGVPKMNLLQKKRVLRPSKMLECETVVVSSDDEDAETGEKKAQPKNPVDEVLGKLGEQVTLSPISKEPSPVDIQKYSIMTSFRSAQKIPVDHVISTFILCRTVRIGSYRYIPPDVIKIDSNGILLKVPHPKQERTIKVIRIDSSSMVKVLINFQKSLPVIFFYLIPSVGAVIREALDMVQGTGYYFDPLSETEEAHRRITLLPETMTEDCRVILLRIYQKTLNIMEEISYKEANDILIKTCPKDLARSVLTYGSMSDVKQILTYPPEGRDRISINTEDYLCLGQDQFLNDVIIDFYLKYLVLNMPKEQQDKVHVFSTFFYKKLTTKPTKACRKSQPTELDPNLSPAERRHSRVKNWTRNVNVFDKDFVIVPINENCHWFLAIICFPNMNGCNTMDGTPIKIEPKQPKKPLARPRAASTSPNTKVKKEPTISCEDGEASDKDEAEGDDSELESSDSEETAAAPEETAEEGPATVKNEDRPPIKQPCILIFDSLAGANRSRIVATLRDYLTCEYKAKMNSEKIFTKDVIKGACPKVPQQNNFTDCGLYLLQYVEQFFNDPIKDYYIPISHIKNWFEEIVVTKKREDISLLIKSLMNEYGKDITALPDVTFPTENGEIIDRTSFEKEDNFMDPEEEEATQGEHDEGNTSPNLTVEPMDETSSNSSNFSPLKPSSDSKSNFIELPVVASILRPDVTELQKQASNKDTLSYLKAKRIIRHKNTTTATTASGEQESKKIKLSETL